VVLLCQLVASSHKDRGLDTQSALEHLCSNFRRIMAISGASVEQISYAVSLLPEYLSDMLAVPVRHAGTEIDVLSIAQIRQLPTRSQQYAHLLLLRHHLTERLKLGGLQPLVLLQRARTYEALGYWDLAVGDAYSVVTVAEYEEEGGGDLVAIWGEDGDELSEEAKDQMVRKTMRRAVVVLKRCLEALGCGDVANGRWEDDREAEDVSDESGSQVIDGDAEWCMLHPEEVESWDESYHYGLSRREVYPWNSFEGDRMSNQAIQIINGKLHSASQGQLEVRKTVLPDMTTSDRTSLEERTAKLDIVDRGSLDATTLARPGKENAQLGLFATQDLPPDTVVLNERSALTAIRPHGEALCDACAGDLSDLAAEERQLCPGCGIPFCSRECLEVAMSTYHAPNTADEETDEGYPPEATPFCPGSVAEADIANLGRAESSDTPEWDLYFLLVTRALQMAETLDCHPLEIWECKYLWGSFEEGVSSMALDGPGRKTPKLKRTLPYSLRHHVELPLQWFELLLLSREGSGPYSKRWVERYDWWVIQTLFAKFRGVADAKLSSWTGEPETAGVFPLWCLANHSCDPGVTWEGGGVRKLRVRKERVELEGRNSDEEWEGLKAGEEVWNHYTDVREKDHNVRRDRLRELLGGDCRCTRCLSEEQTQTAS
jgi:hypothetical protein